MYKYFLLLVIGTSLAQNNGDLESLIRDIYNTGSAGNVGSQTGSTDAPPTVATPRPSASTVQTDDRINEIPTSERPRPSTIVPPLTTSANDLTSEQACETSTGQEGICVLYYLCDKNDTIITDGVGLIDIRVRDTSCSSYMDTCCLPPDRRQPDNPITPPPPPPEKERKGCGWRNEDGIGFRITGNQDREAMFGEFPWMVAILKIEPVEADKPDSQKLNVYVGGGSLIHQSVVLTTAHYVAGVKELHVRAGEWDTQTKSEIFRHQDQKVNEVVIHEDFSKGNLFNDVALLFLAKPMDLAPNIGLACLPPPVTANTPKEDVAPGTRCFATGWGKDQFGKEGRYQVILKKVDLPVVDRDTCQTRLRTTRLGQYFVLHHSFMCAGGEEGRDTCKGDGGSPLVCPIQYEDGRYVQSGMVAWGIGCGENGIPGVYVDVAAFREWVDDKVVGRGLDTSSYTY